MPLMKKGGMELSGWGWRVSNGVAVQGAYHRIAAVVLAGASKIWLAM